MFRDFLSWSGINTNAMLRHGSVAVITMLGIGIFFGISNVMLAFPIALMSILLDKQNIHIKTFSKISGLILLNLIIVFTAYVSSVNFLIGIPINFIAIFLIMYTLISSYDMTSYKPFIMLYVFTQYSTYYVHELPTKFASVVLGLLVVTFFSVVFNPDKEKSILEKKVSTSLTLINNQLENIINRDFKVEIRDKATLSMRELAHRIYLSRYRKYLLTYLGRIEFNIYLNVEHLNLYLSELNKAFTPSYKEDIEETITIVSEFINYCSGKVDLSEIKSLLVKKSRKGPLEIVHILEILDDLLTCFKQLEHLNKKQNNKLYKSWKTPEIDSFRSTFKEYFKPSTIRFKFAMRTALTLTFALLVGEFLGLHKVVWAIITVMSIIQPYYEDTIKRTKDRIKGNIVAIIFVGIIINIVNVKIFTICILVIAVYLLYGYKEYNKLSLFAGIASICVSSLSDNINELLFYRVFYVFVGVVIIIIANKVIFPYRIKDGISQLMVKIMRYNNILIDDSIDYIKTENNAYGIADLILHITLLSQKLHLRNLQYSDNKVTKFIGINNKFSIELGYKLLREYKRKNKYLYKPT